MKVRSILFLISLISIALSGCSTNNKIQQSVIAQLAQYPQSTLQDLYKNFFQDRFGPGHIVSDTASAAAYLRYELDTAERMDGPLFDPTAYHGNFYRVNLSLVKDGTIPFDTFFDAFIRSVNDFTPMPIDQWREEWSMIQQVIDDMNLDLPNYVEDKAMIAEMLRQGKYAIHHSQQFSDAYDPHYRIISTDIVEAELMPLVRK